MVGRPNRRIEGFIAATSGITEVKRTLKLRCLDGCGIFADDDYFPETKGRNFDRRQHDALCQGCTDDTERERDLDKTLKSKAGAVITTHAQAWADESKTAYDPKGFAEQFAWHKPRIVTDLREVIEHNVCPYGSQPHPIIGRLDIPHALMNLTLDRVNVAIPPYYGMNTIWCCNRCNNQKGKMPFEKHATIQRWHKQRRELLAKGGGGGIQIPLF